MELHLVTLFTRKGFAIYAETCLKEFGDRVKYWITFNEPHTFAVQGYDVGLQAPSRCSILLRSFCRAGNSATEPYIVGHNVLLSHATVVQIYKEQIAGMDDGNSPFVSIKDALKNQKRIKYHNDYLTNLLAAIREDGCNVRGYFVWSLLYNWEWGAGFSSS